MSAAAPPSLASSDRGDNTNNTTMPPLTTDPTSSAGGTVNDPAVGTVTSSSASPMHFHHREGQKEEEEGGLAAAAPPHDRQDRGTADDTHTHSSSGRYMYGGVPHLPPPDVPVPPVRMQRRRSSLGQTACSEIGEAAAEHLQHFLETTQLERTDSGNARRYLSRDDADELAANAKDGDDTNGGGGAFVVDDPRLVAPGRSQTASPTLPGQTQASYRQYIDMFGGAHGSRDDGNGNVPAAERTSSMTSAGSRTSGGSHASTAADSSQHNKSGRCYLPVRTFHMDEIVVGRLLGTGTFNDVYEAFLVPQRQERPVYGRQASLPSSLGRERERGGPTTDSINHASSSSRSLDVADGDRQEHQYWTLSQDATSASHQPTYGQMGLNDEPASSPGATIRRRPSSADSHPSSGPRYVLKHLKDVVMEDYDTFLTGAVDLAVEAKMLSHLHHPNIIRLEGVTAGSLSDALSTGIVGGYFLVLEMLRINLLDQIVKWAEEKKAARQQRRPSFGRLVRTLSSRSQELFQSDNNDSLKTEGKANGATAIGNGGEDEVSALPSRRISGASSSFRSLLDSEEDQSTAAPPPSRPATKEPMFLYHRRLTVAAEIAAGFAYLHRKNILYRDVKPQNIGLDHNGTVKIFDMGLAKELHEGDKRKHTGNCGTKRYMSPECGRFEHYGLSSDVYSFSLLLWEILALERPYAKLVAKDFSEKVYFGSMRPTIPSKWPRAIWELLPDCWTNEKNERPTMETVANVLRNMAEEAKPFVSAYAANTSSRSLHDGMSDISSVVSEVPSKQGGVAGGKARPSLLRRPSMTRGSFRLGGSSRSVVGESAKRSTNEEVFVPKNIRKWLEEQEKNESNLDSETLRAARTGGARAASRRNSASVYKRPEDDSIEQKDSFQGSQEVHDPLAKSTGDNDRRISY